MNGLWRAVESQAPYTLATKLTVSAIKLNVSATKSTATSCRIHVVADLLPVSATVDRVEFNFVASVYRALRRFFKSPLWTHHMATHNGNKLTCISGTVTDSIEIPTTAVLCIYLYSLPHTEIWKRYHKMLRYRRSRSEVVPVESPYATSYLSSIVMQCV